MSGTKYWVFTEDGLNDITEMVEFDSKEKALKRVLEWTKFVEEHPDYSFDIKVIKGHEVEVQTVEVTTKIRFVE